MKGKIFNAQEVQAIIAGNKTMFREVLKVQPTNENQVFSTVASSIRNKDIGTHNFINPKATWEQTKKFKCPYQVGQKIFVKESFWEFGIYFNSGCYADDCDPPKFIGSGKITFSEEEVDKTRSSQVLKKRPAQHMKQEHSRITLEITNIKVERLADISEEDCEKEGVDCTGGWNGEDYDDGEYYFGKLIESEEGIIENTTEMSQFCDRFACKNEMFEYAEDAFEAYWNSTHKKPEEKFEANPFVWVVDFKINK